jgi:HupE / UreJ protein
VSFCARWVIFGLGLLTAFPAALAHTMMMSQVLVSFEQAESVQVRIDIDLTLLLGSPERYYELATEPPQRQQEDVRRLVAKVVDNLQLFIGAERLSLVLRGFSPAKAQKSAYLDASMSKLSTLSFAAILPASTAPLRLVVPLGAQVDYPVAYTVQIPAAHLSITRWLEEGMHESDPFVWAGKVPERQPAASHRDTRTVQPRLDPEALPWYRQLALYLRLGFRHIVPEGADHILFVLGLFFLGITVPKLISQTTVFTVAHATTLFLSTYGVFSLPSRYVEPAIALSITVIALENIFKPKLGPGRLAIVFAFGLIHGLGFASSLSELPFPEHDFIMALLGFNFGVDFGQLFVIAIALLAVGWFRHRPWFRARIAVPCSAAIAMVGLSWAVQRAIHYYGAD